MILQDSNCKECAIWQHSYVDNELDTATAARVRAHLDRCAACHARYAEMAILGAGIRHQANYHSSPDALAEGILNQLRPPVPQASKLRQLKSRIEVWFRRLVPAFSLSALVVATGLYIMTPTAEDMWVDELVSAHVRSLQDQHLVDVPATDRRAIKPWFAGKLDFSPPVYDFEGKGYPLVGARLDYLQRQNVAALAYKHNKHVINVFVLPTTSTDSAIRMRTRRGYNIAVWQKGRITYRAISDLNEEDFKAFCDMLSQGGASN